MEDLVAMLVAWKAVVVGVWFALFFVGERLLPAAVPPPSARVPGPGWRRLGSNVALWVGNSVMSVLVVVPLTVAATQAWPELGAWRPDWWTGLPGLALDVVLLDFLIYWWHRANHVVGFFWRFHEVHHRDRFLDTTSAVRFHTGEVLLSALARAAIIVPLALPLPSILAFEALVLMGTIFHHSNLRLAPSLERPLSLVVITPSIHWVHHHAVRADTDSNYGTLFSFWDRLFSSRSRHRRLPEMRIGVEGEDERPLPGLLALPFLPRRAAAPSSGA